MMGKKKMVIVAAAGSTMLLAGCSTINTQADQVALHYKGGAIQASTFADCVDPAQREWAGPGDAFYTYPASQRNWVFGGDEGSDTGAVTFVTSDGIEMSVTGVENFTLTSDCGSLQQFHEQIGNRYAAYTPEGWDQMLRIYIGQPLETAIDRAGQAFTYQELYFDPAKKAEWEKAVVAAMPELVNRQTEGEAEYFGGFAITLQKPDPPASVKDALVEQQAAVAKANAAKAQADAQVAAAQAQVAVEAAEAAQIAEKVKVLGIDGYLKQEAIDANLNPYQPTGATPLVPTTP